MAPIGNGTCSNCGALDENKNSNLCNIKSKNNDSASQKCYAGKVLKNLSELRYNNRFCDVEIIADGKSVKAHRAILAASSPYFHAMFTSGLCEEQKTSIELHSVTPRILTALIDFIYTGEVVIDQSNVQELMIAADMLQLHEIVSNCTVYLKKELHASNAIGIYRFAEGRNCAELTRAAINFIECNFPRICLEEEFFELPKELLTKFLISEKLRVDTEFQVFEAALSWINHDINQRRRYVFDILQPIRLPLLSPNLLEQTVNDCTDSSLKVALKAIRKDIISKKGSLVPLCVQPRLWAKRNIYLIGGSKREDAIDWHRKSELTFESVERFNTNRREWYQVAPMAVGRILPGVASLNGKIYVVGGELESQILANGECYDPCEDKWTEMASMIVPRCEFGLCALSGYLYAIGGWVGEDIGDTIERYDPKLDKWQLCGQLPAPRFSMGVVSYDGLIYIVGGSSHVRRHLQDLQSYNPVTREWTILPPMTVARAQMGFTVFDGYLYVIGGMNRYYEVLDSVERYSFAENKWSRVPAMKTARASPAVAAANGLLFVMGGDQVRDVNFYRKLITITSVECFDPRTMEWQDCPPLPDSRSEAGAVVM